ncbi:MAG: ATP-binding cassette domain-containing protein [Niabella sp.]
MRIVLADAGKRYNHDWIFRHVDYQFESGNAYAVTGHNGSGKSTLLQVLAGAIAVNEGKCTWNTAQNIAPENVYQQMAICAPYLELVEEMTLPEFLLFHGHFKHWLPGFTPEKIIAEIGLEKASHKRISQYSSGMKQRVKLAQCIFSDTAAVMLDEPCTNLDTDGITLYHGLIEKYCGDRLVIISSNDPVEYRFCNHTLEVTRYKVA